MSDESIIKILTLIGIVGKYNLGDNFKTNSLKYKDKTDEAMREHITNKAKGR